MPANMGSEGSECVSRSTKSVRQGGPRRRQWAPKVRTGCMTCKIRRVKCDETRPSCQRCVSTGRECDGYEELELINIQHTSNPSSTPSKILIDPSIRLFLPGNATENHHFDFFRSVTTMNLASFLDTDFWSKSVLKASHHYPALFHATIAFGSMHRSYLSDSTPAAVPRDDTNDYVRFSLVQFNKAIRSLSLFLSRDVYSVLDQQVILTTCILFTCICVLQGRQDKAFMHINNGLRMINHWRLQDQNLRGRGKSNTDLDALMLAFIRLDTQIRPYLDGQEAFLQWAKDTVIPEPLDLPFGSLFDAYIDLEAILNRVLRVVLTTTGNGAEHSSRGEKIEELTTMALAWDSRLAAFLSESDILRNEEDENALNFLRLRRVFMTAMLAGDMDNADNELIPVYEDIIQLSVKVLKHKDADETLFEESSWNQQPQHPVFKLACGVVEPLYVAGTRCRDPNLRRKALRLLHIYPRREGICEGMVAERIVSAVIDAEENNCQRSIDYRRSLLVPSRSSPSLISSPSSPSDTLSAFGYSYPDSMTESSDGSASVGNLPSDVKALNLSPCSGIGDFVCQRHRVVKANFLLLTERQLKVVLWTAEDLNLNKKGRSLVTFWW